MVLQNVASSILFLILTLRRIQEKPDKCKGKQVYFLKKFEFVKTFNSSVPGAAFLVIWHNYGYAF